MKLDTKITLWRLFFVFASISLMGAYTYMNAEHIVAYLNGTFGTHETLFPGLRDTHSDIAIFCGYATYMSCSAIFLWSIFSSKTSFIQVMYPEFRNISSKL